MKSSSPDAGAGRLFVWVGLFASFTYLVLSAWANIMFGDRYSWINEVRLLSIAAGTLLYFHALRTAMGSRAGGGGPIRLALYVAGASLIMLALRYGADQALSEVTLPIGEHIMWVLVWAGYFGLWISAFREMEWRKTATPPAAARAVAPAPRRTGTSDPAYPHHLDEREAEAWAWVIDALADEMSRHPPAARAELLNILQRRAGYEAADDLEAIVTSQNRRAALVEQLARIDERSGRSQR